MMYGSRKLFVEIFQADSAGTAARLSLPLRSVVSINNCLQEEGS